MIIVTGVGRSGTSVATKILAKITGTDLDTDEWHQEINAGLEHPMVVALNSSIIAGQTCGADFNIEETDVRTDKWYPQLSGVVKYLYDHNINIIKDPRFCYSLDVWLRACEDIRIDYVSDWYLDLDIVVCTRNAQDVMLSVQETGAGMPEIQHGGSDQIYGEIFNRHNNLMRILAHFGHSAHFIRYEHFINDMIDLKAALWFDGYQIVANAEKIITENFNGTRKRH